MRIRAVGLVSMLVLVPSCRQILGLEPLGDAGASGDADAIGNGATCVGDTLHSGDADTACAWGCVPDGGAHCGIPDPAGGGVVSGDLEIDPQLLPITLDNAFIDGDTGVISGVRDIGGVGLVNGIGYAINGNVAVFRFASLTIHGMVQLRGTHPIALVSPTMITFDGEIDAAASGDRAGPGGFAGGLERMAAAGSGGGSPGAGVNGNSSAGAGGGDGAAGGAGGGGESQPPTLSGPAFGDAKITMLIGGGGGGGGGGGNANTGGGGGGALQLIANTISVGGAINAGGGGGRHGGGNSAGAGGGAGGTILIEAMTVQLSATCFLAANGGGGGGGGSSLGGGTDGDDGNPTLAASAGGNGNGAAGGDGGDGGAAVVLAGQPGQSAQNGGGGGGGVGWIRVNTRTGAADVAGGVQTSPQLGAAGSTATQGKLAIH